MPARFRRLTALTVTGALALAACSGGGSSSENSGGMIEQLTFVSEAPAAMGGLADYNPYAVNATTKTWLYEPLMIRNGLTCKVVPWLATDYAWSDGTKKLTFTIRDGVKWSDGKTLTAKDVAFTFNLAKKYPAIDRASIWKPVFGAPAKSVTAKGNKVEIIFAGNAAAKFEELVRLQILPEHVYSKVGDVSKYIDKKPVGTGPFEVGGFNGRRLELVRRADYWQADKIKVKKLIQEGNFDASQASLKLRSGQLDSYSGEIPNPKKSFVDANPKTNHLFYPPDGSTVLSPNLERAPFNDPEFRAALAPAINRKEISNKASYGIMKPASQTGLKLPLASDFLPEKYAAADGAKTVIAYDPKKAAAMLDKAGYRKGKDGKRRTPDGKSINITFSVQSGWIDYLSTAEIITRNFNALGITTKTVSSAPESVDSKKKSGDFDMVIEYINGGCEHSKNLGAKLSSDQIPTKQNVLPNVQRWKDPKTDATIRKLSATVDPAEQKKLVGDLADTMMTEHPVIPLIYAPTRLLFSTKNAVGWPSADNPYAHPVGDRLITMTRLKPAP